MVVLSCSFKMFSIENVVLLSSKLLLTYWARLGKFLLMLLKVCRPTSSCTVPIARFLCFLYLHISYFEITMFIVFKYSLAGMREEEEERLWFSIVFKVANMLGLFIHIVILVDSLALHLFVCMGKSRILVFIIIKGMMLTFTRMQRIWTWALSNKAYLLPPHLYSSALLDSGVKEGLKN